MVDLARRFHLHGHDLAVLALNCTSWSAGALLAVLQFPPDGRSPLVWGTATVVVLAATVGATLTQAQGNAGRDRLDRDRRRRLARSIVEDACRAAISGLSTCPERTGAIVFLPRGDGKLESTFTFNKRGKPDSELSFEKWQGATGHAWGVRDQVVALLDQAPASELRDRWKLTPDQIALTSRLKVVVATPIWSPEDPETMLGVVSIDSDVPNSECQLASEQSLDDAIELAQLLAHVLILADLV